MKYLKEKSNIIIVVIALLSVGLISFYLLNSSFLSKNSRIDKVMLKYNNDSKRMKNIAMFVENASTGNYEEYNSSTTFPINDYVFNVSKSGCLNGYGDTIAISDVLKFTDGKIVLKTQGSAYCYLYFDQPDPDIVINYALDNGKYYNHFREYGITSNCTNSTATWDNKYSRLSFDSFSNVPATCTIDSTNTTSIATLRSIVEDANNLVARGNTGVVHETFTAVDGTTTIDAGYRYEGGTPNNFVWFNDEMWRIIGSVPTKIDSSGTIINLVKIIRTTTIGSLARNSTSDGSWTTSTTLYQLLNNNYYGANNDAGTNCIGYSTPQYSHCDYSEIGINPGGKYGNNSNSIIEVYWETGASTSQAKVNVVYENEIATRTVQGKVGLMSAADYGFAQSTSHDTNIYNNLAGRGTNNWLYSESYDWVLTPSATATESLYISVYSFIRTIDPSTRSFGVRPVVYLQPGASVVSGTGTPTDPYILR